MKFRNDIKNSAAFTLIELLVVITIMGILAAIAVPSIKNISKGHATQSASRQMLDDIAHARQLAIAQHTTVYMVFVPLNFWNDFSYSGNSAAFTSLSPADKSTAQTLLDRQLAAYNFITLRSVGDQPGRNSVHYLSSWKTMPEGTFLVPDKFSSASYPTLVNTIAGFPINNLPFASFFPFPSEESPMKPSFTLPYLAFNYLGQLESGRDEYIPLARGNVSYPRDANKVPQFGAAPATATESPLLNSVNSYVIVHIDWITGRARVEQQQVQ